ncbi:MAG: V-type ATPase subunit [Clostridia bacterium]|nr:V-type ATPase subunit [Clostridia bacterium]
MTFYTRAHIALATKVRAMTATTLHKKDYDAMAELHSIPSVAGYLHDHTRYREALKDCAIANLHRGKLEQLLRNQIQNDIRALLHYTDIESAFFLKLLEAQESIEKLKLFLRLLHLGRPEQILEENVDVFVGKHHIKNTDLAQIKDFSTLIELIRPTPFYRALCSFHGDFSRQDSFYLEVALDTYWAKLVKQYTTKYLSGKDAKAALRIYGTEFDLENLVFLLRCKKRFAMSHEEIYACMIPYQHRLRKETITHIVTSPSLEAAHKAICEETPYTKAFSANDRFYEMRKNEYLYSLYQRMLTTHPYSVISAICYVHLRRLEINNIVSLIEGIRYGHNPKEIKSTLIGYSSGGEST